MSERTKVLTSAVMLQLLYWLTAALPCSWTVNALSLLFSSCVYILCEMKTLTHVWRNNNSKLQEITVANRKRGFLYTLNKIFRRQFLRLH